MIYCLPHFSLNHTNIKCSIIYFYCSKKRPHASVGTHGYMAPEVLSKSTAYDSSADWFSFGCMLYKLLKGHSPFRQHKTKVNITPISFKQHSWVSSLIGQARDRPDDTNHERRTSRQLFSRIKTPFRITSPGKHIVNEDQTVPFVDVPWLILSSLQRDVDKRLGCGGQGAEELKNHPFFTGVDWVQVYQQKYPPPLIPPRGEVNAADAFDIGSFDEEDTKGLKLTEADQELYKNFPLVISERWQNEVSDKVI